MKSEWVDCQCGNLSKNKLTRNLSENIQAQLSQLAEPLWADPGIKSGISVRILIPALKRKESQAGNEWMHILPKSLQARKKPPPPLGMCVVCPSSKADMSHLTDVFCCLWWEESLQTKY